MTDALGPLPAADWMLWCQNAYEEPYFSPQDGYTAEDMEAERLRCYELGAAKARAEERERWSKVCAQKASAEHRESLRQDGWTEAELNAFQAAAESIDHLISRAA